PEGFVRTYGDIEPGAPRLVGRVLARHDPATGTHAARDVPWHRVVRADGSLPVGAEQLARLRREGVPIRGGRVDLRVARMPLAPLGEGPPVGRAAAERVARPRARRVSHAEAARILSTRDPVVARLLDEVGPPRLRRAHQ